MLHQILVMTIKELKVLSKDRGTLFSLFLLPIVFIFVMTAVGIGGRPSGRNRPIVVPVVVEDEGEYGHKLLEKLKTIQGFKPFERRDGSSLNRRAVERLIAEGSYRLALIFPRNFSKSIQNPQSETATVTFLVDPATSRRFLEPIKGVFTNVISQSVAQEQAPHMIKAGFDAIELQVSGEQKETVALISELFLQKMGDQLGSGNQSRAGLDFKEEQPADYQKPTYPTPEQVTVPSYTIFGIFFIIQTLALSLVQEKQDGTFRRLMAAPMGKATIIFGKMVPFFIINILQVVVMFSLGVFAYGMDLGNAPGALVTMVLATSMAATSLGLCIASVGKTMSQVSALGGLLSVILAAVGGMFVPASFMPSYLQVLARMTPHFWALEGFQDVMVRSVGINGIFLEAGVLVGLSAIFSLIAVWRFRFD